MSHLPNVWRIWAEAGEAIDRLGETLDSEKARVLRQHRAAMLDLLTDMVSATLDPMTVSPPLAVWASEVVGWERTLQIVGSGGLSGATAAALRNLVELAMHESAT